MSCWTLWFKHVVPVTTDDWGRSNTNSRAKSEFMGSLGTLVKFSGSTKQLTDWRCLQSSLVCEYLGLTPYTTQVNK